MLNVTDATKSAYTNSTHKNLVISFPNANVTMTNSDLKSESLSITEAIENNRNLSFQGCIASQLKFQCADIIQDLRGELVQVTIQADNTEVIPLFTGYIDTQNNRTHEDVLTEFTAYDPIYKLGQMDVTSWYNGLTFPMTIKQFRDAFFTQIGITQETVTLLNDDLTIGKVVSDKQITALSVMRSICQANARYGRYGRDGYFHYTELKEITIGTYPSEETYPAEDTYPSGENANVMMEKSEYINVFYEPFETAHIDKVNIIAFNGSISGSYGSGTNALNLADNIVAQGCTAPNTMAQNIYGKVNTLWYIPSDVDATGKPWLECGDIYLFNTRKTVVRAYILNRTIKGIQALFDKYEAKGDQYYPVYKESIQTRESSTEKGLQEANVLILDRATISQLNAVSARVGSLEADHVTTAQLNAVDGKIDTLTAKAITTENFTSQKITSGMVNAGVISANKITTGQLSVNQLDVDTLASSSFSGKTINCGMIYASNSIRTANINFTGALGYNGTKKWAGSTALVQDIYGNNKVVAVIEDY